MKILVVTPRAPFSRSGACEKDRTQGIEDLQRLGHEVRVVTKTLAVDDAPLAAFAQSTGIPVRGLRYSKRATAAEHGAYLVRLVKAFGDGAAAEWWTADVQAAVREELDDFKPDLVWFEYTYLWPLYFMVRRRGIPIITRSINYEPAHFLDEVGRNWLTRIRYPSKVLSEWLTVRMSDAMLSITPAEEAKYRSLGARYVRTLPLRDLPNVLAHSNTVRDEALVKCCFMGSTYSVSHNRRALEFLLREVFPEVETAMPRRFQLWITGKKFPDELKRYLSDSIRYEGYVENLDAFLDSMDVAIVPSIAGHGMQQKIFEPITRGLPTVTHCRGLAGYPFKNREHVMCARQEENFASRLIELSDAAVRERLSQNARTLAESLFSRDAIDTVITDALRHAAIQ